MRLRQIHKLSFLILFLCMLAGPCKGQKLYKELIACGDLLQERRSDMYDYIENYLLYEVDKDSIRNVSGLDIIYNLDMGFLYSVKYNDEEKAIPYLEYCRNKLYALRDDKEVRVPYKSCLEALQSYYFNTRRFDKAKKTCEEFLAASITDDINSKIINTYSILSAIYEQEGDSVLAYNAHNECQLGYVKLFVKNHPEQSAVLSQFKMLQQSRKSFELREQTDSIGYVNTLILLGNILKTACGNDVVEPFSLYLKAYRIIHENGLLKYKTSLLEECYVNLQEIYIKYVAEPTKSIFIKQITPDLIYLFDGILSESDIYQSFAASFGAKGFDQQALDYNKLALSSIKSNEKNVRNKKIRIYKSLLNNYWGLKNDTANVSALACVRELKTLSLNYDDSLYSDCLLNEGIALRYLHKENEAIAQFKDCLPLFKNRYGATSDFYISCLNQIALTVSNTEEAIKYLTDAKELIKASANVTSSTIHGVSLNLARCYIVISKWQPALEELEIAEQEEKKILGKANLSTLQLKEQCIFNLKQGN